MPKFSYVAINKQGKEIKGIEEAEDIQVVLSSIKDRGLFPVKVIPVEKKSASPFFAGNAVNAKAVTLFTRQLSTLIGAGLPLVRALKIVEEQQPRGHLKNLFKGLVESIESGGSFSDALNRYPNVFSKLYVNMIRAGEAAGLLDLVLSRLADYFEKGQKLQARVKSALIYPCVVLLVALVVLIGLMIFVVPKFTALFSDMGIELPLITRILISTSKAIMTWKFWVAMMLVAAVIKVVFSAIMKSKAGKYFSDRILLGLPIIGKLMHKMIISRFASTLGTLVSSGVPILNAINIVRDTVNNEVVSAGLKRVHDSVKEGESIVAPIKQAGIFDSVVVNMVAVGEETGKLDEMLMRIASTYENEVDVAIAGLASMLEPFLIVTLAVIIGFIVISLFLPLVKLLTTLAA